MSARCTGHKDRLMIGASGQHENVSEFEESLLVVNMKKDIVEFIPKSYMCWAIKTQHKKPPGLLH